MKDKFIVCVNELSDVEKLKGVGVNTFLFPIVEYSIGHNTFDIVDIPSDISSYLLINRILDCEDVDNLTLLLKEIPVHIKGIFFQDVAVFEMVQELNLDLELIWYQNHFGTSSRIVNFWNEEGVTNCVLATDITRLEIENIVTNSSKEVIVPVFGYVQVMYSRRKLLSNYNEHYGENLTSNIVLNEVKSDLAFIVKEDDKGSVLLNKRVYNGLSLLDLNNVRYFLIDATDIDIQKIALIIQNPKVDVATLGIDADTGFLDKETIYKLRSLD